MPGSGETREGAMLMFYQHWMAAETQVTVSRSAAEIDCTTSRTASMPLSTKVGVKRIVVLLIIAGPVHVPASRMA